MQRVTTTHQLELDTALKDIRQRDTERRKRALFLKRRLLRDSWSGFRRSMDNDREPIVEPRDLYQQIEILRTHNQELIKEQNKNKERLKLLELEIASLRNELQYFYNTYPEAVLEKA